MAVAAGKAAAGTDAPNLDLHPGQAPSDTAPMSPVQLEAAKAAHQARAAAQFAQLRTAARVVVTGVLLAVGLRSFAWEPFNIPSESMLPTLIAGDYLFVAKWPYGYGRFTLPLGLRLFDGRLFDTAPARGDVVVFKSPRDNRTDFIKRVVGLPGDRVRLTGGRVEINGVLQDKQPSGVFIVGMAQGVDCDSGPGRPDYRARSAAGAMTCRYPRFVETAGARRFATLDQIADDVRDDTPLVVVPQGRYFVLGDNRDDSADSRLSVADGGVGLVPATNLIGRADVVFFSVDGSARLADPLSWFTAVRWARIGTRL